MIDIKNKKRILIISILVIISIAIIGLTISYFTFNDKLDNKLEIGDVNIENNEEFNPTPDDNGNIKKIVSIKNISTKTNSLVRVNITPRWVDEYGNPWSGDVSDGVIILNFYAEKDKIIFEENWLKGNDGYYYYKSILETSKETYPILQSVKINLKDDNGNNLVENPKDYEGKTLIIDVNSEAIQPTKQAYIDAWNINDENIKIMLDTLLGAK